MVDPLLAVGWCMEREGKRHGGRCRSRANAAVLREDARSHRITIAMRRSPGAITHKGGDGGWRQICSKKDDRRFAWPLPKERGG